MSLTSGQKLEALIWKYGQGILWAEINPKTGNVKITRWEHQTLPKPTAQEIENVYPEYEQHLETKEAEKKEKTRVLKTKLEISDEDLELLKEILKE